MRVAPLLVVRDIPRPWPSGETRSAVSSSSSGRPTLGDGELHLAKTAPPTVDRPGVRLVPPSDATSAAGAVVLHVDDVNALATELTSIGLAPLAPPREPAWGGERRCFLRDPDGHLVELTQRL